MYIRPFQPDDESAVVHLWHACGLTRPWNDPHLDIARKLTEHPELFLVATEGLDGGTLIGTVMAGYEGHRGWINYLAVSPEKQGQGIGRALMLRAEQDLLKLGCPKISLLIRSSNAAVQAFYATLGFSQDDAIVLGKRLIEDGPHAAN